MHFFEKILNSILLSPQLKNDQIFISFLFDENKAFAKVIKDF